MFKISGLDHLKKMTDQLSKFAEKVEGDLANVSFDPSDPSSIEDAIQTVSDAIDEKSESFKNNKLIGALTEQLKERSRNYILERAAAARLENNKE